MSGSSFYISQAGSDRFDRIPKLGNCRIDTQFSRALTILKSNLLNPRQIFQALMENFKLDQDTQLIEPLRHLRSLPQSRDIRVKDRINLILKKLDPDEAQQPKSVHPPANSLIPTRSQYPIKSIPSDTTRSTNNDLAVKREAPPPLVTSSSSNLESIDEVRNANVTLDPSTHLSVEEVPLLSAHSLGNVDINELFSKISGYLTNIGLSDDASKLQNQLSHIITTNDHLMADLLFIDQAHINRDVLLSKIQTDCQKLIIDLASFLDRHSVQDPLKTSLTDSVSSLYDYFDRLANSDSYSDTTSSSQRSLGDIVSPETKEMFATYHWETLDTSTNSDFRKWFRSTESDLPAKNSKLNCWEGVIVLLTSLGLLSKADIQKAFASSRTERVAGSSASEISMMEDSEIILWLLGFPLQESSHLTPENHKIEPGDIIVFDSVSGTKMAHVALGAEQTKKSWVFSLWNYPGPEDIMKRVTLNRLIESYNKQNPPELLHKNCIRISTKFRDRVLELIRHEI